MITDKAYRESRAEGIRKKFIARSWKDVGADFLDKVKIYQNIDVAPLTMGLKEGRALSFKSTPRNHVDAKIYFQKLNRILVESSHLYESEEHGMWLRGPNPVISIPVDGLQDMPVLLYIALSVAPGSQDCLISISDKVSNKETAMIRLRDISNSEDEDQKTAGVGQDVPLAALDLLARVKARYSATFRGLHRLAIDHSSTGRGLTSFDFPQVHDQHGVDGCEQTGIAPGVEVTPHS